MRFAEAHGAGSLHREVGNDEMARLMSVEESDQFTKGELDSLVGAFERADWDGEVRQLYIERHGVFSLGTVFFNLPPVGSQGVSLLACQKMRENGWRLNNTRRQPNRIFVTCENLNKRKGAADWNRGNKHTIDVKFIDIVKSRDDFFFCEILIVPKITADSRNRLRHCVCDGIAGLTALVADLREEQRVN